MKINLPQPVKTVMLKAAKTTLGKSVSKNAPTILLVGGVAAVGVSTFLACRATLKLEETIDKAKADIDDSKYSEDKTAFVKSYAKGVYHVAKLYTPAAVTMGAGIGCIIGAHDIQANRLAAMTSAYTMASESLRRYRDRIAEEFGEDKDQEIHVGARKEKISVTDEDGKKKKKEVSVVNNNCGPVNILFDYRNPNYHKIDMYDGSTYLGIKGDNNANWFFLRQAEKQATRMLLLEGKVYLDEVYKMIGVTKANGYDFLDWEFAHNNGWVYDDTLTPEENEVSFGLHADYHDSEYYQPHADFRDGYEECLWLNFKDQVKLIRYDVETHEPYTC